jgi:hypothetical protein
MLYGFHYLSPFPGTELFDQGLEPLQRQRTDHRGFGGGLAGVGEVMARYDKGIALVWDTIRKDAAAGEANSIGRLQKKQTLGFVWTLLQEDTIEKLGKVRGTATPQQAQTKLIETVAQKFGAPLKVASQEISRLSQNRWLQPEPSSNGFIWHWT